MMDDWRPGVVVTVPSSCYRSRKLDGEIAADNVALNLNVHFRAAAPVLMRQGGQVR